MVADTRDDTGPESPTRRAPWTEWVTFAARLGLAGVLFWAGWTKFTEPAPLQRQAVAAYELLPDALIGPVGHGLPVLEMVLALLLVVGFATRLSAILSGLLMIVFIGGIASAWARGLTIDCGCFGGGGTVAAGETKYLQEILRDVGYLALAVWITVLAPGRLAVDRRIGL
ncbi:MauE/DoxX family redox-associated membrane protein [Actinocorallia sp. A-T 12471]|uniref:MauE/DoxX family redox-associated membrane protein n=1 Tax=Actinocorallia sp. A-T 12471 TaxID=3089813 RepID=UPI0029D1C9D2|nr:MauE/DoxX family redox-associated membrane protein [Actinocorallia sp. A-T 12471]MDX6743025.1 MauE/DoxX family redox-associated membrane protein [Actinocorallia sp. A-T 12471]